ncbi:MAG: antibiotic biosynthesis monooxygenase [Saprospiraceae bacterium]
MIALTPATPYYAVIFTSIKNEDDSGYDMTSERMHELSKQQPGYLGIESARNELGITVSYWDSLESIKAWKENMAHLGAQRMGKEKWYADYRVRICKVEREYGI